MACPEYKRLERKKFGMSGNPIELSIVRFLIGYDLNMYLTIHLK